MLHIKRRVGEKIYFKVGDVEFDIMVSETGRRQVSVSINAPDEVKISRDGSWHYDRFVETQEVGS